MRVLHDAGKEGKCPQRNRHNGGSAAQRGADQQTGKGDQRDQQHHKWQSASGIYQRIQQQ